MYGLVLFLPDLQIAFRQPVKFGPGYETNYGIHDRSGIVPMLLQAAQSNIVAPTRHLDDIGRPVDPPLKYGKDPFFHSVDVSPLISFFVQIVSYRQDAEIRWTGERR